MMDACLSVLVWSWFPFGFRLVFVRVVLVRLVIVWLSLVLLVLACLLLFGSLVVRSSGLVLDAVDGVLDAWFACLVCLVKKGPPI
jgi:hypothetical protein